MASVKWRLFCLGLNMLIKQTVFERGHDIFNSLVPFLLTVLSSRGNNTLSSRHIKFKSIWVEVGSQISDWAYHADKAQR